MRGCAPCGLAELCDLDGWSLGAKFDGELAGHTRSYGGTATCATPGEGGGPVRVAPNPLVSLVFATGQRRPGLYA